MKIIIEQFWQDLGEVEKRIQDHTKEVLKHLRDGGDYTIRDVTMQHEGILVQVKGITEDTCLDVVEVGEDELVGAHIYTVDSFDVYELLHLLRYLKDNVETNLNARMEDEGDEGSVE